MISYTLNKRGNAAEKYIDGNSTGEWLNIATNQAFLAWIAEGNAPNPYVPPPAPPEPTIDEKLASVGLTLDDLKTALGIK